MLTSNSYRYSHYSQLPQSLPQSKKCMAADFVRKTKFRGNTQLYNIRISLGHIASYITMTCRQLMNRETCNNSRDNKLPMSTRNTHTSLGNIKLITPACMQEQPIVGYSYIYTQSFSHVYSYRMPICIWDSTMSHTHMGQNSSITKASSLWLLQCCVYVCSKSVYIAMHVLHDYQSYNGMICCSSADHVIQSANWLFYIIFMLLGTITMYLML